MGVNLADQIRLLAPPTNGFTHDFFSTALGIHLGGIDQRHPQIQAFTQRPDLSLPLPGILAHVPGALTNTGYAGAA